jgi:hypothetical protein
MGALHLNSRGSGLSTAYSLDNIARARESGCLVDAATVAAFLGVDRGWVYEHAGELGACRLGSGPRARLRFSLAEIDSRLTGCSQGRRSGVGVSTVVKPIRRRRREAGLGTTVALLPIKGRREAG